MYRKNTVSGGRSTAHGARPPGVLGFVPEEEGALLYDTEF